MAFLIIPAVVAIGAELLASVLGKPKKPGFVYDDRPTVLTDRGGYVPLLMGRRRVTPEFLFAGDREIRSEGSGGGKGGGGGGSQNIYWESGWHALCVGPAQQLDRILMGGHVIWGSYQNADGSWVYQTPLNRSTVASGSTFDCLNGEGTFTIYWGENDQPVNDFLSDATRVGVASRWPFLCYILWNKKRLGSSAIWPSIEYELYCDLAITPTLTACPSGITESTPASGAGYYDGSGDDGINPAFALWQLLTGRSPWGAGLDPSYLNRGSFEKFAYQMNSEHLPFNYMATDGTTIEKIISDMMNDYGFVLDQVGDQIAVKLIRPVDPSTLPTFSIDLLNNPLPERTQLYDDLAMCDRVTFTLTDRFNEFRKLDIVVDNDSLAYNRLRVNAKSVGITCVTDRTSGQKIANRRTLEFFSFHETYTFNATRDSVLYGPGDAFILNDIGVCRIVTSQPDHESTVNSITAILDQFSVDPSTYTPPDIHTRYPVVSSIQNPRVDFALNIQELPFKLNTLGFTAFIAARLRANQGIAGADIYASVDNTTYLKIGSQNQTAFGGTLNTPLYEFDPWFIEHGPVFTPTIADDVAALAQDLSTNLNAFWGGNQVMLIGQEIFFLRNLTAVTGGFRLDGIMRARYDTKRWDHFASQYVWIFNPSIMTPFYSSLFTPDRQLWIKVVPYTLSASVDISTITPYMYQIGSIP